MDTYRRFSTLDPQLPLQLLPAGWLRQPAREMFAAVYDGLAQAAESHVRAVADRYAVGERPEIHANTVASLLADGHLGHPPGTS
jgi:phenylacetic acid degradation operon negative regulatory protein